MLHAVTAVVRHPGGRAHRVVCGFVFRFAYRSVFRPRRPVAAPGLRDGVGGTGRPGLAVHGAPGHALPAGFVDIEAGAEPDDGVLTSSAGGAVKKERFGGEPGGQV